MREVKIHHANGQIFQHCWRNENDQIQGEYKFWWENGQIWQQSFYKDGKHNGESKVWNKNGQIEEHLFFHNAKEVDISGYVEDINNITEHEYFQLQLIFGYFPIIKFDGNFA